MHLIRRGGKSRESEQEENEEEDRGGMENKTQARQRAYRGFTEFAFPGSDIAERYFPNLYLACLGPEVCFLH